MKRWLTVAGVALACAFFAPQVRLALHWGQGDMLSMALYMALFYALFGCGLLYIGQKIARILWCMKSWWRRPAASQAVVNNVGLAEQALQRGRTRKALKLLRQESKTNVQALRPLIRIHLQHRRAERALQALQEAILHVPCAEHVMLFRKVRPLVHLTTLQKFKEALQVAPDTPVVRRILALDALLEGRSDADVLHDIALQAPALSGQLLQAAVRAKQQQNTEAMHLLIKAALPENDARGQDDLASVVQSLVLPIEPYAPSHLTQAPSHL